MKQIITPVNFSKRSKNALDFAIHLAGFLSWEITLVNVFELKGKAQVYRPLVDKTIEKLSALKMAIEEEEGIVVNYNLYEGSLTQGIIEASEDKKADLVIMGTLGAAGIRGKLFGAVTSAVVAQSEIPVIVVPVKGEWKKPERILLALNNFDEAPEKLSVLFHLAVSLRAEIHLLVFSAEGDETSIALNTRKIQEYETALNERFPNVSIVSLNITGTKFIAALERYIYDNQIDMLTMVTYKRDMLETIVNPSLTRAMINRTRIPLLAIPARKP